MRLAIAVEGGEEVLFLFQAFAQKSRVGEIEQAAGDAALGRPARKVLGETRHAVGIDDILGPDGEVAGEAGSERVGLGQGLAIVHQRIAEEDGEPFLGAHGVDGAAERVGKGEARAQFDDPGLGALEDAHVKRSGHEIIGKGERGAAAMTGRERELVFEQAMGSDRKE